MKFCVLIIAFVLVSSGEALELSPTVLDMGDINAQTQSVPFQFTITTSSAIKPTLESGCGCIIAKLEPVAGKTGVYTCCGDMIFGMMKGLVSKPVKVQVIEGGRTMSEVFTIRANAIPVGDILPGSLVQWKIRDQPIVPKKVTLLFSPSVKIKRITLAKQSDVYAVTVTKKDQSGMSWELSVKPKVMPKKPMVLPESIRLSIESDSPRVTEVVLFAMIDP